VREWEGAYLRTLNRRLVGGSMTMSVLPLLLVGGSMTMPVLPLRPIDGSMMTPVLLVVGSKIRLLLAPTPVEASAIQDTHGKQMQQQARHAKLATRLSPGQFEPHMHAASSYSRWYAQQRQTSGTRHTPLGSPAAPSSIRRR
jgi:hypothetical protein